MTETLLQRDNCASGGNNIFIITINYSDFYNQHLLNTYPLPSTLCALSLSAGNCEKDFEMHQKGYWVSSIENSVRSEL